eukprot:5293435-Pleurochrysis_carterae.AAC.3
MGILINLNANLFGRLRNLRRIRGNSQDDTLGRLGTDGSPGGLRGKHVVTSHLVPLICADSTPGVRERWAYWRCPSLVRVGGALGMGAVDTHPLRRPPW